MGAENGFWQQMIYILIIAVSMVFGGYLYRKRHSGATVQKYASRPSGKKRPRKKR